MKRKKGSFVLEKQILKLKKLVARKEQVILRLIEKGKKLALVAQKKEIAKLRLIKIARRLALVAREKESARRKLEKIAWKIALVAKKKEKRRRELFKKNEEEARRAASLTESIVETSDSGFLVIDHKGKVLKANRRFVRLWHIPNKILVSRDDKKLLKFVQGQLVEPALFMKKVKKLYENPTVRIHDSISFKDGRVFDRFSSPMCVSGKPVARVWSFRDITKRKKIEKEIQEQESLLENAQVIANFGSYVLDIKSGYWTSSKVLDKIFGIGEKYSRSIMGWLKVIHPDDRKMMEDYFYKEVLGKGFNFDKEYRIVKQNNGVTLWVHGKGRLEYLDKKKKPVRMIGTIQDITAGKELEQAKNEFIFLASHQLRTPLSGTKWVLETMGEDKSLSQEQKEKIDKLTVSNERLIHIVNKMLDVARVDTGKVAVIKKWVKIKELVDEVVDILKISSESNKKTIKINIAPGIKNIYCDPTLISEAIKNLLDNAINHSESGSSSITISAQEKKDNFLFSVHSKGAIDPLIIGKINKFEKFIHGCSGLNCRSIGSGLGLYITRKLIEANGGSIWLKSSVKSGTTFYFTIIKK
ncbi:MAG: ATP-binding protein [Candidatus Paceibacterota bacterium]